jgi:hypothetical protein
MGEDAAGGRVGRRVELIVPTATGKSPPEGQASGPSPALKPAPHPGQNRFDQLRQQAGVYVEHALYSERLRHSWHLVELERTRFEIEGSTGLAENTGGLALTSSNDLTAGARHIVDAARVYYLFGYYAPKGKGPRDWRQVKVEVKHLEMSVRARNGYILRPQGMAEASLITKPAWRISRGAVKVLFSGTSTRRVAWRPPLMGTLGPPRGPARVRTLSERRTRPRTRSRPANQWLPTAGWGSP